LDENAAAMPSAHQTLNARRLMWWTGLFGFAVTLLVPFPQIRVRSTDEPAVRDHALASNVLQVKSTYLLGRVRAKLPFPTARSAGLPKFPVSVTTATR
jgi:hypothetical protein